MSLTDRGTIAKVEARLDAIAQTVGVGRVEAEWRREHDGWGDWTLTAHLAGTRRVLGAGCGLLAAVEDAEAFCLRMRRRGL